MCLEVWTEVIEDTYNIDVDIVIQFWKGLYIC